MASQDDTTKKKVDSGREMTTHEEVVALMDASAIVDGTGCLYTVCEQAIRDGEGTPERVREIWAEATVDAASEERVAS